jgi:hypothetical protein
LSGRKIEFVFNQPWDLIANSASFDDKAAQSAAQFSANNQEFTKWLTLLDKIRTYYQKNP